MISSRLLRQFVAVAEELHYGRAAARLHMAQPPLSQGIKRLEEIVGVQLLERSRHSVRLTNAGAVFLAEARNLLAQEERALEATRRAAQGIAGRVCIGFVGSVSYELLPRILQDFRARYPAIDVDLREQISKEQVASLVAGKVDVGILRLPVSDAGGLQMRVIHRERFVAVLPRGHRLAKARSVRLADLADESFMTFPADRIPSLYGKFLMACNEAGFSPRTVLEAWQMPSMACLVASGVGVVLLPAQAGSLPHPGVVYKTIADSSAHLELEIAVGWRSENPSTAMKLLLSVLPDAGGVG
ncbi:LysR substrate-binding domain-containing protein [Xylophilus sp. GOD-11R]|uniref:LysR substrate-binding domain-containing protein n=1 Tax=Xylophilus sp. GOD-11R TaxID=3089814 RepID=UPI00298C0965|nr:LysR substrate-binding domain-containing protein [Xylophilus sp. GOD-11R]WPB55545.1 LysR substrate-binding domain-containing protein [Xylophilus sp. GOD-11R]